MDQNTEDLVERLMRISDRLFWLAACFATSLSWDVAYEADRYREIFRSLADELRKLAPDELERITQGHEALLFAEPIRKPIVPLAAQQWHELAGEIQAERKKPPQPKPPNYLADGLQSFIA